MPIFSADDHRVMRQAALLAEGRRHRNLILYGRHIALFWLCVAALVGAAVAWVKVDHDTIMKVCLLAAVPLVVFFGWRLATTSGARARMMARATGASTALPYRAGLAAVVLLVVAYLASPWSSW